MKAIFTYLVLVGLPILGILGVLRLGSVLIAPVSVGGAWEVVLTPQSPESGVCAELLISDKPMHWNIMQSGPSLVLQLSGSSQSTLEGELSGTTITANTEDAGSSPVSLQVQAVIDRNAEPDQMQGTVQASQCTQPVSLRAVRLSQKASGEE